MRGFIFGTALIAAEANNRSFCKTIHADIPSFCNCTDTTVGGTAACHVAVAGIESVDVTLDFLPCGEPASLLFDFAETAKGIHQHMEATAGFDKQIDIDRLHVNIPHIGNATVRSHVTFNVVDGHLLANMDLDACGTVLGKKGCGSDIPRSPLPHKVISIDRDIGGFCDTKALEEVATHSCTSDEHTAIKSMSDNEFGDASAKCGRVAYGILSGKFDHDKFNTCLSKAVKISKTCSECYAKTGEYGATNCKAKCITSWCKQGCLTCTAPAQTDLPACTGMKNGTPKPCMDDITV